MYKDDLIDPEDDILKSIFSGYANQEELSQDAKGEIFKKIAIQKESRLHRRQLLNFVLVIAVISILFIGMLASLIYFFEIDYTRFFTLFKSIDFKSYLNITPQWSSLWMIIIGINTLLLLSLYTFLQHKIEKHA